MDLGQVLDGLYQREINFMIYALWDGGITVKLGDKLNGFHAETVARTSAEAAKWLDEQVRKIFPKSQYVTGKLSAALLNVFLTFFVTARDVSNTYTDMIGPSGV